MQEYSPFVANYGRERGQYKTRKRIISTDALKPKNININERESFQEYKVWLNNILPNFPDDVLEQWIYRHYPYYRHYEWIGFQTILFNRKAITAEEIIRDINQGECNGFLGYGEKYLYDKRNNKELNYLQIYMDDNKTWPVPIIVIDNHSDIRTPHGNSLGMPYHLVEGHRRLGYFHSLYKLNKNNLLNEHEVWIITIPSY